MFTSPATFFLMIDNMNHWLRRHILWVWCVLVLAWAGVRVVYCYSLISSPLYSLNHSPESDNHFFDDWAKHLTTDWLNAKPYHPFHIWHKDFAANYFLKHPEKKRELLNGSSAADSSFTPEKALWTEWYGGNQYHQEPLYPYLLAVFYAAHWNAVNVMLAVQLFLGVVTGMLLVSISRKYFGETTALLTGLFYLFCGILMYNEMILLRTSWIVFFTVLTVVAADRAISRRTPLSYLLCGLCIGCSFLMHSSFALFLAGMIAFICVNRPFRLPALKNAALVLAGFFVMFSPVILRNIIVGAPAFTTSSIGPFTCIVSNISGTQTITSWSPSGGKDVEVLSAAHKTFTGALVASLKTHLSVGSYLLLEWQKLKAIFTGIEYANNENFYFYREYLPVLRCSGLNLFIIAPLGMSGLLLCLYYRRAFFPLYLAIIVQLITLLLTYVLARFRAPLVILLLPFAAFFVVECLSMVTQRKSISIAACAVVLLLLGLSFLGYSTTAGSRMYGVKDFAVLYDTRFKKELDDYAAKQQWDKWLALQQQFMVLEPRYLANITPGETTLQLTDLGTIQFFMQMHSAMQEAYAATADKQNAEKQAATINALIQSILSSFLDLDISRAMNYRNDLYNLAAFYVDLKQSPRAIEIYRKLLASNPADELLNMKIGQAFLTEGQLDSAAAHEQSALRANPVNPYALFYLASAYFNAKKFPEAIELLKKYLLLNPDDAEKYVHVAMCYQATNKLDSALQYTRIAISVNPTLQPAFENMSVIYKTLGNADSTKRYETLAQKPAR